MFPEPTVGLRLLGIRLTAGQRRANHLPMFWLMVSLADVLRVGDDSKQHMQHADRSEDLI